MKLTKDNMIYVLLACLFLVLVIFVFALKDGNECVANPLQYGAERGSQSEGGDLFCTCYFENPSYYPLIFNKDNISVLTP